MIWGLTARMMILHFASKDSFADVVLSEYFLEREVRAAWFGSDTVISDGGCDLTRPAMMAVAMLPPPMNPMFKFCITVPLFGSGK